MWAGAAGAEAGVSVVRAVAMVSAVKRAVLEQARAAALTAAVVSLAAWKATA